MPDVTVVNGPALSATTDKPMIDEAAVQAAAEAKAKAEAQAKTTAESATAPGEGATAKPPKGGLQERIDELTKRAREAEEARVRAEEDARQSRGMLDRVLGERASAAATTEKPASTAADPEPKREDFDDPDEFSQAKAAWAGRQAAKHVIAEAQSKQLQAAIVATAQEIQRQHDARVEKEKKEDRDWEATVMRPEVKISPLMAQEIVLMENGPKVAKYLALHEDEAKEIFALCDPSIPIQLQDRAPTARAMAKLAQRLAASATTTTAAPEPIEPLGSRNRANRKTADEETMEEYAARRNAEIAAERERTIPRRRKGAAS